jgi:hypothetical protein
VEGLYGHSVEQIPLRWRPVLGQHHRLTQCGLLIQVGEYLFDDQGTFSASASCVALPRAPLHSDTGDVFDRTTTLGAGFYIDVAYRNVGKGREQDAEALNTRFSRPLKGPTLGEPSSSLPGALSAS